MDIHTLPNVSTRSKKRLGRGHGSGRGKTAGRGTKGQKARGTIPPSFEGGQLSILKRLPYLRGKGRNKSQNAQPATIVVGQLNVLPNDSIVTLDALKKAGIVKDDVSLVKILAGGKISVSLTVKVLCSEGARAAIEKAGGKISNV